MANDPFADLGYNQFDLEDIISPITGQIGSGFGDARNGGARKHRAYDLPAPAGTQLVAPTDMEFIQGGVGGTNLRPNDRWAHFKIPGTQYEWRIAHQGEVPESGAKFSKGQPFGTVGNAIEGTHLHMGLYNAATGEYEDWAGKTGLKRGDKLAAGNYMPTLARRAGATAAEFDPFGDLGKPVAGQQNQQMRPQPQESGDPFEGLGEQAPQPDPYQIAKTMGAAGMIKPEQEPLGPEVMPQESNLMPFDAAILKKLNPIPEATGRPVMEFGGATAGGVAGAGLGSATPGPGTIAGGAAGTAGGYYLGKKVADWFYGPKRGGMAKTILDPLIGPIGESQVAKELEDVREAGMYAMGLPVGMALAKRSLQVGADVFSALSSRMSSVAQDAIKYAVEAAKAGRPGIDQGLMGRVTGRDLADIAVANFGKTEAEIGQAYASGTAQIANKYADTIIPPTAGKSLFQRVTDILGTKRFGEPGYVPVKPDGTLDWSSSFFGTKASESRGIAKEVMEKVAEFDSKPRTLTNQHALKRWLDGVYRQATDDTTKGFITKVKKEVVGDISKAIPEYGEISNAYHQGQMELENFEKLIIPKTTERTEKDWVANQVLNRLMTLMRKDESPVARSIVKRLMGEEGYDQLVGHMFTSAVPKIGPRGAAIELGALKLSPQLMPIFAASSPKLQGQFLTAYGRFLAKTEGAMEPLGTFSAYGLSTVGSEKENVEK